MTNATQATRILVVDDDVDVRAHLHLHLTELGYDVVLADNGRVAVDFLETNAVDALLCDLAMPVMGGLEVLGLVRHELGLAHLPVLLLSGALDIATRTLGLDAGANDFIPKPLELDELAARLRVHLRQATLVKRLRHQTLSDELTDAYNRRGLMSGLSRELERTRTNTSTELSALLIDLDQFKTINDTFGHNAGDVVLQEVVRTLRENVRREDFVGRIGGDEFVVVLPNTDAATARHIGRRLQQIVGDMYVPGTDHRLGISVGIASSRGQHSSADQFLRCADGAMYSDKRRRTGEYQAVALSADA